MEARIESGLKMQRAHSAGTEGAQDSAETQMMVDDNLIYDETARDIFREEKVSGVCDPNSDTSRFLKMLCGDSLTTFQTFDDVKGEDGKKRKDPSLSRIIHGQTEENFAELTRLNAKEAGVFVMVNEGDGKGRTNDNVVKVRALFVDLDGEPLQTVLDTGLVPHIIVESSPGRYHAYWLVVDCPLGRFKPLQQQTALRFNVDKSVNDLCRVMRLPGYVHNKDKNNPFTTKLIELNNIPPYKVEEIVTGLGLTEPVHPLARPVTQSYELSRVEEALKYIDPSILDYAQWRNVGFALHYDFPADGLALFDSWSRQDAARYDQKEIHTFWQKIKDNKGNNIKVATIFKMAKSFGWKPLPDYIEELNKKYFVSHDSGNVAIYCEEYDSELNRRVLHRFSFTDFKNLYSNETVQIGVDDKGNPKYGKKGKAWTDHEDRRQYGGGIVMAPGKNLPDKYNRWKGFAVQPKYGSWQRMRDHIWNNICSQNSETFKYVLGWMARMIQHPELVGEVALVLQGGRGTGKGVFGNWMCKLFGQHSCHVTNGKHITGNFNAHLQDCIFLFADEAFWAGDKVAEETLKGLITEPTLAIEQKGRDLKTVQNMLHILMVSNNDWIVPAGNDERRYCVLKVSDERKRDLEYFKAIDEEMENGGLSAMLYDLLDYDLSGFEVRKVPQTSSLLEQKIQSLDPFTGWWFNKLQEGSLLRDYEPYWGDVPFPLLYDDYIQSSTRMGVNRRSGETQFAMLWKKVLPEGWPKKKPQLPQFNADPLYSKYNKRLNNYQFPSLQVCRSHFESLIDAKIDWETGDEAAKDVGADPLSEWER